MIDSDLADSDLETQGNVLLIESKKRKERERDRKKVRERRRRGKNGEKLGSPCSVSERID